MFYWGLFLDRFKRRNISIHKLRACCVALLIFSASYGREKPSIDWLSFEQLDEALKTKPKKVFIDFYTTWCGYCRKMDKTVFSNPKVIALLNRSYYAVQMDAESIDTIHFDGQVFTNTQAKVKRNGIHQLAELFAVRNGLFFAPTLIILDESFKVKKRYFQYLNSEQLMEALQK